VYYFFVFFFFQAEDGIRDFHVTGVQTCALPIFEAGAVLLRLEGEKTRSELAIIEGQHFELLVRMDRLAAERDGRTEISFSPDLRSEEHTSELQSRENLVCRLLLEKKKKSTTVIE